VSQLIIFIVDKSAVCLQFEKRQLKVVTHAKVFQRLTLPFFVSNFAQKTTLQLLCMNDFLAFTLLSRRFFMNTPNPTEDE